MSERDDITWLGRMVVDSAERPLGRVKALAYGGNGDPSAQWIFVRPGRLRRATRAIPAGSAVTEHGDDLFASYDRVQILGSPPCGKSGFESLSQRARVHTYYENAVPSPSERRTVHGQHRT